MYVIENDKHQYVVVTTGKSPTLTMDINLAHKFPKMKSALTFIKSSVPQKMMATFGQLTVVSLDKDKCSTHSINVNKTFDGGATLSDDLCTLRTKIDGIKSEIMSTVSEKTKLEDRLSHLDHILTDLDHYAEFNDKNVVDSFKLLKMRQSVLRNRREVKNKLSIINSIMSVTDPLVVGTTVDSAFERVASQEYTPRVLVNLFSCAHVKDYNMEMDDIE